MSNFHWCTLFLNYALPPILYIINAIGESIIRFLKKKKKEKVLIHHVSSANFLQRYRRIQILIDTGKDLTLINFKSRRFENSSRVFELASGKVGSSLSRDRICSMTWPTMIVSSRSSSRGRTRTPIISNSFE